MSEAPKKIWVEHEYREWSPNISDFEKYDGKITHYIRADIVEEMRRAMIAYMERFPSVFGAPYRVVDDYKKAIKLLEGEE